MPNRMPDREKIIATLPNMADFFQARADMAVGDGKMLLQSWANCATDALELLKEQEPVKPKKPGTVFAYECACGNCEACIDRDWIVCPWCGKKVNWNAAD